MRKIEELLPLLIDYIKINEITGLCNVLWELYWRQEITSEERKLIFSFLKEHRPRARKHSVYWWKPSHKHYRLKFLNKLLTK